MKREEKKPNTQMTHEGILLHLVYLGSALRGLRRWCLCCPYIIAYDVHEMHNCIANGILFTDMHPDSRLAVRYFNDGL